MIAVLTVLVMAFLIYMGIGNESWGVVAVAIVIGGAVLIGLSGLSSSSRAYWNWVDYWDKGGPERNRRHQSSRRW